MPSTQTARTSASAILANLLVVLLGLLLTAPVPSAQEDEAEVGPRFSSPREVLEAYLENMVEYREHGQERYLDRALEAFRSGDMARVQLEGRARDLYQALNRVEYVRYEDIPGADAPALKRGRVQVVFGPPPSDSEALVLIDFDRDENGWRISQSTLERISEMWQRVRGLPLIDDLPLLSRLHFQLRSSLPEPLTQTWILLEGWQWIGLLVLLFLVTAIDRIARALSGLIVRRLARGERLDSASVTGFGRPIGLLVAAQLFAGALPVLDLAPNVLSILDIAAAFVAAIAGVWAMLRLVDVFCGYLASRAAKTATKVDDVLIPLLRRTLKMFVAILGVVYLASKWTDDLWGVVAGLGVGSIAIAFAARDTIENLFGTFAILLDKPFELGDWILVGDIEGTVEEVGFRSTRIRTFYNSMITVPNRMFVTSEVDNMGRRKYRRVKTMLALTYDTPAEKVEAFCAGVRGILARHPYTRKDYFHVYLNRLGDSSLDVLLYAFLQCPDWGTELREKHRLFADILRLAEELNVGFAFPTQTLHVAKPEDLEHPDRPANDTAGARVGEEAAERIVAKTLAPFGGLGSMPPPVDALDDPHARRGSAGEAGE